MIRSYSKEICEVAEECKIREDSPQLSGKSLFGPLNDIFDGLRAVI